ncbi:MAG: outer membrane protein assembly factor BamB family protein [Planctomycetota bacterium]|jgi:outer membrane protein assembly factor BamB
MNQSFRRYRAAGTLLVVAVWVSPGSSLPAADWPRFRGPTSAGISSDAEIPTQWSDDDNLKWKLEMPGKGFSSPIVVGDYIFVTCYCEADGDLTNLERHLLCVHRGDGQVAWGKVVPSAAPEIRGPAFGTSHGYASHTPTSDGERVYVLFGNTGVLAFDMKGNQLWQQSVGAENAAMFGSASSPILYGDRLIITAGAESESIRALDKKTGEELWKAEASSLSRCYCTPLIVKNREGEDELLISVPYEVWSLNPDTGKLKWHAETKVDMNAVPSPITQDGICYVIGGRSGGRAAIRLGGEHEATETNVLWSSTVGSYVSSPVLYNGHLYWFNDRGIAFCVDAETGKEVARKRLDGQFYASAVLINDKLYAVSRFDGTYVLEATPELTQVAHNRLSDESDFSGSPAVSDGQLILRSDKYLYCIEAK